MRKPITLRVGLPVVMIAASLGSQVANAAGQRSYVSVNGADNASCAADSPCRHLQTALANTAAGGDVVVIDSGEFGPVTISRSVRILASPGANAVIAVDKSSNNGSGRGVLIDAPGADVQLQHLSLRDSGGGIAMQVRNANSLLVEGCEISGFVHKGVFVTAETAVQIRNVAFRNNFVAVDSSARSLRIDDSAFVSNQTAIFTDRSVRIEGILVTGSANGEFGIASRPPSGRTIQVDVERSTFTGTAVAFYSYTEETTGSVRLDVKHTALSGNGSAFYTEGPSSSVIATINGLPIASTAPAILAEIRGHVQTETSGTKNQVFEKIR